MNDGAGAEDTGAHLSCGGKYVQKSNPAVFNSAKLREYTSEMSGLAGLWALLRTNITPAPPTCTQTDIKHANKIQKFYQFGGTYVPYCKEDQGHTEDQRQHVAEGSKSEHN